MQMGQVDIKDEDIRLTTAEKKEEKTNTEDCKTRFD